MNHTLRWIALIGLVLLTASACSPENTEEQKTRRGNFAFPLARHPKDDPLIQGQYRSQGRVIVQTDRPSPVAASDGEVVVLRPAPKPAETPPAPPQPLPQRSVRPTPPPPPAVAAPAPTPAPATSGWPADSSRPHPLSADKSGSRTVYIVQSDDSISSIAKRFYGDTTKRHLLVRANPALKNGRLIIGQRLVIPHPETQPRPLSVHESVEPTPQPSRADEAPAITRAAADKVNRPDPSPAAPKVNTPPPNVAQRIEAEGEAVATQPPAAVHRLQGTDTQGDPPPPMQRAEVKPAPSNDTDEPKPEPNVIGPDAGDVFIYQHVIRRSGDTRSGYEYMSLLVSGDGKIRKRIIGIRGEPRHVLQEDDERAAAFLKKLQENGLFELESRFRELKGEAKKVKVGPPIDNQLEMEPGYQIVAVIDGKMISVAYPGVRNAAVPPQEIHDVLLVVRMFAAQVVEE